MKKIKKIIAFLLVTFMLFTSVSFVVNAEDAPELDYINMMIDLLDMEYYDEVDREALFYKMIDTMLKKDPYMLDTFLDALFDSLDEYSDFFTPEEWESFSNSLDAEFAGIGVTMQIINGQPVIINTIKDSPAQSIGIKSNDVIVAVDGVEVLNETLDQIAERIQGEVGTAVVITVLREGQHLDFRIVRDIVREESVYGRVTYDGIGYLVITKFNSTTGIETKKILEEFDKQGVKNIILDLRGNPGGYLDTAVEVANFFVPEGVIIEAHFKNADYNEIYTSNLKEKKYNLAVLVDENTASAAEVLASAIKESDAGVVIGTNTYGKTSIQVTLSLYHGRAAKITVGKYLTRNGNNMDKVGLDPNEYIENYSIPFDDKDFADMDHFVRYYPGDCSETVLGAKQRLAVMGYFFGELTDEFTPELEEAVRKFQTDCGLYSYGVIDLTTQRYIYNKPYENKVYIDKQFNRAYEILGGDMDNIMLK